MDQSILYKLKSSIAMAQVIRSRQMIGCLGRSHFARQRSVHGQASDRFGDYATRRDHVFSTVDRAAVRRSTFPSAKRGLFALRVAMEDAMGLRRAARPRALE